MYHMGHVKRKRVPSSMRKMCGFTSFCTCAKSHLDICSPLKHSIASNDFDCGQRRSWSDCAHAQADLGLCYPHMPADTRSHGMARPLYILRHSYSYNVNKLFILPVDMSKPLDEWQTVQTLIRGRVLILVSTFSQVCLSVCLNTQGEMRNQFTFSTKEKCTK